ncbi:hypothetical protein [Candidatus Uabimicrobium sp. HlEnr_7]|uniref:hypothetical protein n=1 Tax=Candidatus Uabimicrobium helgolandensis TaxID=3095367 RepID=UPI003558AFC7
MKYCIFFYVLSFVFFVGCGDDIDINGQSSQSSTIQISNDDNFVVAINRIDSAEAATAFDRLSDVNGSLSIIRVVNDANVKVDEITVGKDPRSVSINKDFTRAFVSNGQDNTVTAIDISAVPGGGAAAVIATINVGSEPRGTALTPSGEKLYVANYGEGNISVINTGNNTVIRTIELEFFGTNIDPFILANPYAIGVSDNGDDIDEDETLIVADFFGRQIERLQKDTREGFDNGKEGRIAFITVSNDQILNVISLSPVQDSGFTANRIPFQQTVFRVSGGAKGNAPQGAFFNQLHTMTFRDGTTNVYLPSIAASPEPPVRFNVNVQSLIGVIQTGSNAELANQHFNLNAKFKNEIEPTAPFDADNAFRLDRAFSGDTVAMAIKLDTALFLSRSGAFVTKGFFNGDQINFDVPAAFRIPVGNVPSGIVMNSDATRAFVNADVDATTTVINVEENVVVATVNNADLPAAGSDQHQILMGKLAFFTGMGLPAEDLLNQNVRDIDTHRFRNVASKDNWSSCASCHPDGLSDGVTWIFGTGPRQTIPLDASFSFVDPENDRRVMNWNAVRGSVTDFNNNARNVQGGFGFTPDAQRAIDDQGQPGDVEDFDEVFNHGPDENTLVEALGRVGISDSLNLMTIYAQKGIRTFNRPTNLDNAIVLRGRDAFETFCVDCHSGDKWTTSQILWDTPLFDIGGNQLDDDVVVIGPARSTLEFNGNGQNFIIINQNFETLDPGNPIEVRANAQPSLGQNVSFNPPSLLGVRHTAPYGHNGRAENLEDVFLPRTDDGLEHPTFGANDAQIRDIIEFLKAIDEAEAPFLFRNK